MLQWRWNTKAWIGTFLLAFTMMGIQVSFAQPLPQSATYPSLQNGQGLPEIPTGMRLKIVFLTGLDARTANTGDDFLAVSTEDLWLGQQLLLPKGTEFRGRVGQLQRPGYFNKGSILALSFEHVVLPSGDMAPLDLMVDIPPTTLEKKRGTAYVPQQTLSAGNLPAQPPRTATANLAETEPAVPPPTSSSQSFLSHLESVPKSIAGLFNHSHGPHTPFDRGDAVIIAPGDEMTLDLPKSPSLN